MPSATGLGSQGPGTWYGSNPITSTRGGGHGESIPEGYVPEIAYGPAMDR